MKEDLPKRIIVAEVLRSRYKPGQRPVSWDERSPGLESVRGSDGEEYQLFSNGGQSTPAPGWELLLTNVVEVEGEQGASGLEWTLYGIKKLAEPASEAA